MKKILFSILLFSSLSFAQWSEQISGVSSILYSVSPLDNNNVWVCGMSGKVLRTTNGGVNWNITASPNSSLDFYTIWGINASTALVAGITGSPQVTYVYKTINSGVNWTQVFTQTGGFIDGIASGGNPNVIFMNGDPVGGRWSLWFSTNSGNNWDSTGLYLAQANSSETGLNNSVFYYSNPNVMHDWVWFGTNNSRIYRGSFTQTQTSWIYGATPDLPDIYTILFVDSLHGFTGGNVGIANTSNGGINWVTNTGFPGTGFVTGIALKTNELWAASGSTIFYSFNYGANWVSSHEGATVSYWHLAMSRDTSSHNIWAVGSGGVISKYTYPIGIKPISSIVPNNFILYQNYPNPFNPSTTIKFDLPKSSFTIIIVYDALGREVTSLVNERLSAGTYDVKWDASNYPSGVYFYKLSVNNGATEFTETRRMVLLK